MNRALERLRGSLHVHEEGGVGRGGGRREGEGGFPFAGDLRDDGGAILARGGGAKDFEEAVHDGARRRQAEFKPDFAHVHQLTGVVAEFNENVVGGGSQLAAGGEEAGGEVGDGGAGKGTAGHDVNGRHFGTVGCQIADYASDNDHRQEVEYFEESFHASRSWGRMDRLALFRADASPVRPQAARHTINRLQLFHSRCQRLREIVRFRQPDYILQMYDPPASFGFLFSG